MKTKLVRSRAVSELRQSASYAPVLLTGWHFLLVVLLAKIFCVCTVLKMHVSARCGGVLL